MKSLHIVGTLRHMIGRYCVRYYVLVSLADAGAHWLHCALGFTAGTTRRDHVAHVFLTPAAQTTTYSDIFNTIVLLDNGGDAACHHHS